MTVSGKPVLIANIVRKTVNNIAMLSSGPITGWVRARSIFEASTTLAVFSRGFSRDFKSSRGFNNTLVSSSATLYLVLTISVSGSTPFSLNSLSASSTLAKISLRPSLPTRACTTSFATLRPSKSFTASPLAV